MFWRAGGAAGLLGLLGVACGGDATQPSTKRTQPVTLESWSRFAFFKNLADKYTAGPGSADRVTINAVMVPEYMAAMEGTKEPRAALREMHEAIDRELAKPA